MRYSYIIAPVLVVALCVCGAVLMDDSHQDTGTWTSGDCTVTLDENGVLTVTGTGAMQNYSLLPSRPWHHAAQSITSVVIEDGVTAIGNYSFSDCYNLTSVTILSSPTIGQYAFRSCTSLSSASLGTASSVGHYAFRDCTSLTRIDIPATVTNIYAGAFQGCTHVEQVFFESDAWNITLASQCFSMGTQSAPVRAMVFSPYNIADGQLNGYSGSYTTLVYAPMSLEWSSGSTNCVLDAATGEFSIRGHGAMNDYAVAADVLWADYKPYIISVVAHNGVTAIGQNTFSGCDNLVTITLADTVTSINAHAFYDCDGFISVIIPDTVQTIGQGAFSQCADLEYAEIGDGVTDVPPDMFNGCISLEAVEFGASVRTIGQGAFYLCRSLASVTIPDSVTVINTSTFYGCGLTDVHLGSVTAIGSSAFRNCESLTEIRIPATVTSIGAQAFDGCYNLAVLLFETETWNVTDIGEHAIGLGVSDHHATCVVYSHGNIASGLLNDYINEYTSLLYADIPNVAVTIRVNNAEWGSVNLTYILVERGTTVEMGPDSLVIGQFTVVATPNAPTAQYTYAFGGWTGIPTDSRIVEDTTITANFTRSLNSYTVTIEVNDERFGHVDLTTVTADYGTPIVYDGNTLAINDSRCIATASDPSGIYTFRFVDWDGPATVTGDTTITAVFAKSASIPASEYVDGITHTEYDKDGGIIATIFSIVPLLLGLMIIAGLGSLAYRRYG